MRLDLSTGENASTLDAPDGIIVAERSEKGQAVQSSTSSEFKKFRVQASSSDAPATDDETL